MQLFQRYIHALQFCVYRKPILEKVSLFLMAQGRGVPFNFCTPYGITCRKALYSLADFEHNSFHTITLFSDDVILSLSNLALSLPKAYKVLQLFNEVSYYKAN